MIFAYNNLSDKEKIEFLRNNILELIKENKRLVGLIHETDNEEIKRRINRGW